MDSIIEMHSQLISSKGETRIQLIRDYFFAVSRSNARFRIVRSCAAGSKNDICEVVAPESYFEDDEPGFLGRNLTDDESFLVTKELTEKDRELSSEFEYPMLEWEEFIECFVPVECSAARSEAVNLSEIRTKGQIAAENHPFMVVSAFVCGLAGVFMILAGYQQSEGGLGPLCVGLTMCLLFGTGLAISKCWTKVEALKGEKKVLALTPAVIGGVIGFFITLGLVAVWLMARHQPSRTVRR